jgi:L-ribulose-5-phosphate 4-epimerase
MTNQFSAQRTAQLASVRQELVALHQALVNNHLVVWTGGNVSARVRTDGEPDIFVIKPSGVSYENLDAASMVVCDLDGNVLEGTRSPSSDTAAHAYVYRNMDEVGGVTHTHSNYACAFAALGKAIPCALTAQADEFGGDIPVGPFAIIGDDSIGQGIVSTLTNHRSPAVLMQNHGVFTIGASAKDSVKAAVMCEDVAKATHLALSLGEPKPIAQADIDALYKRYQNVYGK